MLRWYFRISLKTITMLRKKIARLKVVTHEPLTWRRGASGLSPLALTSLTSFESAAPGPNCTIRERGTGRLSHSLCHGPMILLFSFSKIYLIYVSTVLLFSDTPGEDVGSHYRWL